jgi:hypothetical protein
VSSSVTYSATLNMRWEAVLFVSGLIHVERRRRGNRKGPPVAGLLRPGGVNLYGVVIRTDRARTPGPNGADLWWSGKHQRR